MIPVSNNAAGLISAGAGLSLDLDGGRNFAWLLADSADRSPERLVIEEGDSSTTYNELRRRAGAIQQELLRRGVADGQRVVILLPRGESCAAAVFGVLAAGGVVSLVSEVLMPTQLAHVLQVADASVLVTRPAALTDGRVSALNGVDVLLVDDNLPAGEFSPISAAADQPAQITFTSGSTGAPKGVVASHDNLWAGVRCVQSYLGIRPDDRVASMLEFAFVYGFNQLTLTLAAGATLVVERSPIVQVLVDTFRARGVTVMAAVPPLWQQIMAVSAFRDTPWPQLRLVTNAGGHLPPSVVRSIRMAQPQAGLYLMYGLTEVFRSTFLAPRDVDAHPDSMGQAIPESRVLVLRDDGVECAVGEVGEVVHKGPSVALGYWKDPEATARVFRPDPLGEGPPETRPRVVFSGDLARRDADGRLYHAGRRDALIKTMGYRVSPDEVGDVIAASGQVTDVAVHGVPDDARGQAILAHVVLRPDGDLVAVRAALGRDLPRHMHPSRLVVHKALPRTPNGKIDIPALKTLAMA